ncbi:phosphate ABC transporter permease subunit PstC [Fusibacter sp. JL216-2]|uniref:phosphate ABC transporter permease subunit PstC n=1 Tax=Fusibacter sp. JL216-2 TaxID=3071453 RepID=UPI003D350E0E
MTELNISKRKKIIDIENIIPTILFIIASVSVLTSIGIVITLVVDASHFFAEVPLSEVFSTELEPLRAKNPSFGFLPLIMGTIVTSVIAMLVAAPLGLASAMFLSEFMTPKKRRIIKPIIEVLAGIPTIVYGFFAYNTVTPILMKLIPSIGSKNALSPGIVMGIMIIPIVTSLSEDAMSAVPDSIRQGAYGLGSTKLEVASKVILPAAISGIVAAFVLAISRAIGETMIVTIASGSMKNFTLDVTMPMQTMTAYIVEFTSGDAGSGTVGYYSLYAVGLILFIFTLVTNLFAKYITKKYRREY